MTVKRNQSNFIFHRNRFMTNLGRKKNKRRKKKNPVAFTMWFYFSEMLAYSREQQKSSRLLKNVNEKKRIGVHLLFSLHEGCWDKIPAGPSASWPCTELCICTWGHVRSSSALLIPAHGAFWMSPKKRGHFFCVSLVEMPSDDIVWVWAAELFEMVFSLSLCAQGTELKPCLNIETRNSAVLPQPAKAQAGSGSKHCPFIYFP